MITELLRDYLEGKLDRKTLNSELRKIRSKIFESKNSLRENGIYVSIIHWINAEGLPDVAYAYNDDEIKHVYKALIGEEGYNLSYTSWWINNNDISPNALCIQLRHNHLRLTAIK